MLPSTPQELVEAFSAAKNLNAALKSFLKREGNNGGSVAAFAKEFRNAAGSGKVPALQLFVERNFPVKELYFIGAARYAFPELVESTVGKIIERYAEEFNATYSRDDQGVSVTDTKNFKRIVAEVRSMVEKELQAAELPKNNFMVNSLLATVFEVDVLAEVVKVLE